MKYIYICKSFIYIYLNVEKLRSCISLMSYYKSLRVSPCRGGTSPVVLSQLRHRVSSVTAGGGLSWNISMKLYTSPLEFYTENLSNLTLPKFRKFTYTMNSSYSRPVSLDPVFSKPAFLCYWIAAVGRPFQLNMSMPCVVPPMLWTLEELKQCLIDEFPILATSEGEGCQIWFDFSSHWTKILCSMNWGYMSPLFSSLLLSYNSQHSRGLI